MIGAIGLTKAFASDTGPPERTIANTSDSGLLGSKRVLLAVGWRDESLEEASVVFFTSSASFWRFSSRQKVADQSVTSRLA